MQASKLTTQLTCGTLACLATSPAYAGSVVLGTVTLPVLEGGLFTVAVVALVAGIRIIRRKQGH